VNIYLEENNFKVKLQQRGVLLAKIRQFFAARGVLEVETPLLLPTTNPAPYLNNFKCGDCYLQSSPEFAMKRILARGSGDIYQICKAFRQDEKGRLHLPEFTLLEWYRLDFNHHDLMQELAELLKSVTDWPAAKFYTYLEVCQKFLAINPHTVTLKKLQELAKDYNLLIPQLDDELATWMQLLFTQVVEPNLEKNHPIFIYDFPASQAMLAKIRTENYKVASRFELYYNGVELANGFHELNDPQEQRSRFNADLAKRKSLQLPLIPLDEDFIHELSFLPDCSGVALGIDRLLLLITKVDSLAKLFPLGVSRMVS
jgi:lysyl-tRNA synthetase class 2